MKPIPVDMDDVVSELVRIYQAEILLLGPQQWMERITGLRTIEYDNQIEEPGPQFITNKSYEYFIWVMPDNVKYLVHFRYGTGPSLTSLLKHALKEAYETEAT